MVVNPGGCRDLFLRYLGIFIIGLAYSLIVNLVNERKAEVRFLMAS